MSGKSEDRARGDRLKEALRANLRRRKAAARKAVSPSTDSDKAQTGAPAPPDKD